MVPNKIATFGGSSVAGVGDPEDSGFIGRLKKWHESQNFNNLLYNLGISGDTTTGMVQRLQSEASIRDPQLVIITTGLNDIYRKGNSKAPTKISPNDFQKNIKMLIKQGKSLSNVIFLSAYPIDESKTAPLTYWSKNIYYFMNDAIEYQRYVKDICTAAKIPYCDIFNEWLKTDYKQWLSEDGLHANPEGHRRIYETLKAFLENLYMNR